MTSKLIRKAGPGEKSREPFLCVWNSREVGVQGNGTDWGSVKKSKDQLDGTCHLQSVRRTVGETRTREFVTVQVSACELGRNTGGDWNMSSPVLCVLGEV